MKNHPFTMFRIWHKKERKYTYETIMSTISNKLASCGMLSNDVGEEKDNNNVIELCTGIEDCKGKLIYEGDIVLNSFGVGPRYIYFYVSPNSSNVIQYILSKDTANPLNGALHNLWNGKDLEVVGNIHEHSISDLDKTYGQSDLVRQTINKIETSCKKYNWRTFED